MTTSDQGRWIVVWPDVEARAWQITSGRVIPNLVVLGRNEESH